MRDLWDMARSKSGEDEIKQLKAFDAEREQVLKKFILLASQVPDIPAGFISVLDEDNHTLKPPTVLPSKPHRAKTLSVVM